MIMLFSLSRDLKAVTFLACILEVCSVNWAATPTVLTGTLLFSSDPPVVSLTTSWTFFPHYMQLILHKLKMPFDETPGVMQPNRQAG